MHPRADALALAGPLPALAWLAAFCVFSLLAGLALKDVFRVEM